MKGLDGMKSRSAGGVKLPGGVRRSLTSGPAFSALTVQPVAGLGSSARAAAKTPRLGGVGLGGGFDRKLEGEGGSLVLAAAVGADLPGGVGFEGDGGAGGEGGGRGDVDEQDRGAGVAEALAEGAVDHMGRRPLDRSGSEAFGQGPASG